MKTILVSGASGIVGYGILRSLKQSGKELRLIGTTIYSDSIAQAFCDIFELAPLTTAESYTNWILKIVAKYEVDMIIPGIEVDMYKWAKHIGELAGANATVLLNSIDLIDLTRDKWRFYERLKVLQSPYVIESSLDKDYDLLKSRFGSPFLLKPRSGFGSKGIVRVESEEVFSSLSDNVGPVLMVQQIVGNDDEEFTTSAFGDGLGGHFARMTLKRVLSKDGFTEKGEVYESGDIEEAVSTLCQKFKPIGPTNFQFRRHDGALKLIEINPRVSSATSIRSSFGYNECQMAVEYFLENKKIQQPVIRRGRAIRYVEDFIFYENRDNI
jgi:carbamoyl-phosphate synthase large subunit